MLEPRRRLLDYASRLLGDSHLVRRLTMRHHPFRSSYHHRFSVTQTDPPMAVDTDPEPEDMHALFAHIQRSWQHLGETEPHWSVLTDDAFKQETIDSTGSDFYDTGKTQLDDLLRTLERNEVDRKRLRRCLEYGCGVGRVTHWLAGEFDDVQAYDISRSHLQLAEQAMAARRITNVRLCHMADVGALARLPQVDLVYSVIVLQHNPPPLIAAILRALLRALAPQGVAYFQVPTYRKGYRFSTRDYLASTGTGANGMEMHVLPQPAVFRIIAEEQCLPLEVLEDTYTGIVEKELSNTFLVRRT